MWRCRRIRNKQNTPCLRIMHSFSVVYANGKRKMFKEIISVSSLEFNMVDMCLCMDTVILYRYNSHCTL